MTGVLPLQEKVKSAGSKLRADEIIRGSCALFDINSEESMPCSVAILLLGCINLQPHLDAVARKHVLDTSLQQLIVQQRGNTKSVHESGARKGHIYTLSAFV